MAMAAEADPLVSALGARPESRPEWALRLPCRLYRRSDVAGVDVLVAANGTDPTTGVDCIGTQAAALTTHVAIEAHRPDLVLSVGTAGGWERAGAEIGDVFVAWDRFVHHDRRIELPGFRELGVGNHPAADIREAAEALGCRLGLVTTGDSLDESDDDRVRILASGAEVKEMEAAAVAWVSGLHGTPVSAVKAITDLVDHHESTGSQFEANLRYAVERLVATVADLVPRLAGTELPASQASR